MLCGNFILPEPASYVFFFALFNLRNLLYLIFRIDGVKSLMSKSLGHTFNDFNTSLCISALNIKFRKASNLKAVFSCGEIWRSACASNQHFPLAVPFASFTADIVFILQRFHNSLDRCNGFSGLFCNFLLFYRRVLCDQF